MRMRILVTAGLLAGLAAACGGKGQTQNCKSYLACEMALGVSPDGGTISSVDNDTYGPNGTCWLSDSTSKQCDSTCATQLKALSSLPGFNKIPACADGGH